jgi:uncharacterized protein YdeI (YjbR/CyaY-like superfamily)
MRTSKGIDLPIDLADAFREKPKAWEGFEAMRQNSQKDFVLAIESTTGPVTRRQRIERTIREAETYQEKRPTVGVRLP